MKCLLVSYTGIGVNSTDHAAAFGCGLARLGCEVTLAVDTGGQQHGGFEFHTCTADGALHRLAPTASLQAADVVHVWTPRAPIWRFLEANGRLVRGPLVLHLEDDESEILRSFGAHANGGGVISRPELRAKRLEDWTHPVLGQCLASAADGATVISPELGDEFPAATPRLHVFPPLAPCWWEPVSERAMPCNVSEKATVVFAGGLHPGVADDFFELCRAVKILADRGHSIRLVRCGPKADAGLLQCASQCAGDLLDLGPLSIESLRALLAHATVLVQPGGATVFNRRRMPAKLAPYLGSGTPVVMPSHYSWLGVRHREHAILFDDNSVEAIAAAITSVLQEPEAARAMGARSRQFARERFDLARCCAPLLDFYRSLPAVPRFSWQAMRQPRLELPLLVAVSAAEASRNGGARLDMLSMVRATLEEIRTPVPHHGPMTVAQLFWPTKEEYLENVSSVAPMHSRRWNRLVFGPQLLQANSPPRFDPGDRTGILELTAIDYRSEDGRLLQRFRPPDSAPPSVGKHGTTQTLVSTRRNVWRWLSTGNDPQLLLPALPQSQVIRIECWLRWTPTE